MIRGSRPLTKRRPTTPAENKPDWDWEVLSQFGAVLFRPENRGPVWIAIDQTTADALCIEEQQREEPCPVLTAEDVAHLESKSEEAIRATLEVIRAFPGAKIVH
jgi:hypothetical protein